VETTETAQRKEKDSRLGITPTQVLASALAAVTAAFLGSTLGVAGTVIGAGVASLVSTIGSAVYQRSLDRTGTTLRSKVVEVRRHGRSPDAAASAAPNTAAKPAVAARAEGEPEGASAGEPQTRQTELTAAPHRQPWWRRGRALVLLTASAFVLGMGVVTAVEMVQGGPISGGDAGTTVGHLFGQPTRQSVIPPPSAPTGSTGPETGTATTSDAPTSTSGATPTTATPSGTTTPPASSAPGTTTPPPTTTTAPVVTVTPSP
jgi:hypothetical protein